MGAQSRKTTYAQQDAEIDGGERLEVKQTRQLSHSMPSAVDHTRQDRIRRSMAGGGRGRRDCRLNASPAILDVCIPGIMCLIFV